MIDLHPVLSGLPFASALLLVGAEVMLRMRRTAGNAAVLQVTAVLCCVLSSTAAFLSGYQASSMAGELSGQVETAMGTHHALGRLLLISSIALATFFFLARVAIHGKSLLRALYAVLVLVYLVLTLWVGNLGGQLVFTHGINVKAITPR